MAKRSLVTVIREAKGLPKIPLTTIELDVKTPTTTRTRDLECLVRSQVDGWLDRISLVKHSQSDQDELLKLKHLASFGLKNLRSATAILELAWRERYDAAEPERKLKLLGERPAPVDDSLLRDARMVVESIESVMGSLTPCSATHRERLCTEVVGKVPLLAASSHSVYLLSFAGSLPTNMAQRLLATAILESRASHAEIAYAVCLLPMMGSIAYINTSTVSKREARKFATGVLGIPERSFATDVPMPFDKFCDLKRRDESTSHKAERVGMGEIDSSETLGVLARATNAMGSFYDYLKSANPESHVGPTAVIRDFVLDAADVTTRTLPEIDGCTPDAKWSVQRRTVISLAALMETFDPRQLNDFDGNYVDWETVEHESPSDVDELKALLSSHTPSSPRQWQLLAYLLSATQEYKLRRLPKRRVDGETFWAIENVNFAIKSNFGHIERTSLTNVYGLADKGTLAITYARHLLTWPQLCMALASMHDTGREHTVWNVISAKAVTMRPTQALMDTIERTHNRYLIMKEDES